MFRLSTAAAFSSRLLRFGIVTLLATACAFSTLLLGFADLEFRRGDQIGLRRALRIAPLDAGYLAKWSLVTGNAAEARQSLQEAVASDPWYSWAWIQLGLAQEAAGQASLAEHDLLRAAAVDRGFDPRWALCNYYFRRNAWPSFWGWTRAALSNDSTDSVPVLRLAWRATPDVRVILDRAVPPNDTARRKLLKFLIAEHPLGADFSAISTLLPATTPDDAPMLNSYANKLLDAREITHAVEVWNSMCDRHLLPFARIQSGSSNLLTNAAFASPPSNWAFDWHFIPAEGITAENHAVGSFALAFSGNEPEHWRILTQRVAVQAQKRYEFKNSGTPPASGLAWKILEAQKTLAESSHRTDGEIQFVPSTSLVTIAFDYDRPRGETRLAGQITISGLSLHNLETR